MKAVENDWKQLWSGYSGDSSFNYGIEIIDYGFGEGKSRAMEFCAKLLRVWWIGCGDFHIAVIV